MSEIDSSKRELEKLRGSDNNNGLTEEDNRRLRESHFQEVINENMQLKGRVNELSALLIQILDQVEQDLFNDQVSHITRQNLIRIIKQRIKLTPEILDIVNKSKEPEQQPIS